MRGVVTIPNTSTEFAAIERDDGFIMVVQIPPGCFFTFRDPVEVSDIDNESKVEIRNLATGTRARATVHRIDIDLPWEEKMALRGKKVL